jgi:hypothetical protein
VSLDPKTQYILTNLTKLLTELRDHQVVALNHALEQLQGLTDAAPQSKPPKPMPRRKAPKAKSLSDKDQASAILIVQALLEEKFIKTGRTKASLQATTKLSESTLRGLIKNRLLPVLPFLHQGGRSLLLSNVESAKEWLRGVEGASSFGSHPVELETEEKKRALIASNPSTPLFAVK